MANFGGGISMGEIPGDTPVLTITGGIITNNSAITDGGGIITNGTPFVFPTDVTLTAIKTAVGAPLEAGQFTFTVFDQAGNPVAMATNDAAGNVTFPAITFDAPGVFSFTVRETGFPTGWTPDTRVFPVIITVIDTGNG